MQNIMKFTLKIKINGNKEDASALLKESLENFFCGLNIPNISINPDDLAENNHIFHIALGPTYSSFQGKDVFSIDLSSNSLIQKIIIPFVAQFNEKSSDKIVCLSASNITFSFFHIDSENEKKNRLVQSSMPDFIFEAKSGVEQSGFFNTKDFNAQAKLIAIIKECFQSKNPVLKMDCT